jgi:molybdopterin-guanine dinucleotide biosynthesis protein A
MEDNNILAVVLAGGKSKRFGEDKNQTKLGDKTLLEHVLLKISNRYEEILIVSSHSIDTKKIKNVTIIPDCFDDFGPLAGVLSAMKWVKENQKSYQWIATFPSDTPFFEISIIDEYQKKVCQMQFLKFLSPL